MKAQVKVGATGEAGFTVEPQHTIDFNRPGLPPVLSTPSLIWFLEHAAIAALEPVLEPGEVSLGTEIEIQHVAPTPVGLKVACTARVVRTDGPAVTFQVEARDEPACAREGPLHGDGRAIAANVATPGKAGGQRQHQEAGDPPRRCRGFAPGGFADAGQTGRQCAVEGAQVDSAPRLVMALRQGWAAAWTQYGDTPQSVPDSTYGGSRTAGPRLGNGSAPVSGAADGVLAVGIPLCDHSRAEGAYELIRRSCCSPWGRGEPQAGRPMPLVFLAEADQPEFGGGANDALTQMKR